MSTFSNPASSEMLNAYVDGTLTAAERAQVESAVAGNPALRQELLELQATATLLGSLPELTPRRSFRLGEEHARRTTAAQPANVSAAIAGKSKAGPFTMLRNPFVISLTSQKTGDPRTRGDPGASI